MKKLVSSLALIAIATAGVAQAEGNMYAGLGVSSHATGGDAYDEFTPSSVMGRIGYQNFLSEYGNGTGLVMGGELRVATGSSDSSVNGGTRAFELDNTTGAYLRLGYSTGIVTPYILAGMTWLEGHYHDTDLSLNAPVEADSASFGIGLDYNVNESLNIGLEMLQAIDEIDELGGDEFNSLSLVTKMAF